MADMTSQPVKPRIGFLGAGRMATALATAFVRADVSPSERISASDVSAEALQRFCEESGARPAASNVDVVANADVVILAVKPHHARDVLREVRDAVTDTQLLVSIAAGVSIASLAAEIGEEKRIIRVMPNTPCLVGAGASAFAAGPHATVANLNLVYGLLSTVGLAVQLDEAHLDAVTGLSGSGPAYVFQIIEALSDGGVRAGLPRHVATQLAAQTLFGAAKMVLESGEHPGVLKDAVASPGGTTIAGLHALERGGLRAALIDAVHAAALRSTELGQSS